MTKYRDKLRENGDGKGSLDNLLKSGSRGSHMGTNIDELCIEK